MEQYVQLNFFEAIDDNKKERDTDVYEKYDPCRNCNNIVSCCYCPYPEGD